ncbi:MAG: hypothetical protein KGL39_30840 [Patescibacteria group bacterium]|nr:hypothetical protein [Patescibacteria group bacterium]
MSSPHTAYFERDGLRFEARLDTIGTDPREIELLAAMEPNAEREARIASLQDNVRHAYEMLLTVEIAGRA